VFLDSNSPESQTYISVILNVAETFTVPDQYSTVQAAIDGTTVPGTRIILRDGIYKSTGNRDINFKGKAISLLSENGPENCMIDCEGPETGYHRAFVFNQLEDHRTIIDGITIIGAYINHGTAIKCEYGSPVIRNCRIMESPSGGISFGTGTYPLIENCFIEGDIDCYNAYPYLLHCDIMGNIECEYGHLTIEESSINSDYRVVSLEHCDCTISDSTITGNMKSGYKGAGINLSGCGKFNLIGCTIQCGTPNIVGNANHINIQGCLICDGEVAGIMCSGEQIDISDCTISSNRGTGIRLSGFRFVSLNNEKDYRAFIRNCLITDNGHYPKAGGISCFRSDVIIEDCRIIANFGPGIRLDSCKGPIIRQNIISANFADGRGGGINCDNSNVTIKNCTFTSNSATNNGGAIHTMSLDQPTQVELLNCILWNNGAEPLIFWNKYSVDILRYCNIQGGWEGLGNIDADPLFADPGYWADANDPNVIVELDDPNAVWVDGDYHLKSEHGRWNPNTQTWAVDDVTSPCIDAGNPNTPVGDEPEPNGGRINMGAYGGTAEASKSPEN